MDNKIKTSMFLSTTIITLLTVMLAPNDIFADNIPTYGGETDSEIIIVESSPEFTIGEKVFIFVADKESESIFGDNYYVASLQHGKYNLDENGNAKNKDSKPDMSEIDLENKIKKAKQKSQKVP